MEEDDNENELLPVLKLPLIMKLNWKMSKSFWKAKATQFHAAIDAI